MVHMSRSVAKIREVFSPCHVEYPPKRLVRNGKNVTGGTQFAKLAKRDIWPRNVFKYLAADNEAGPILGGKQILDGAP